MPNAPATRIDLTEVSTRSKNAQRLVSRLRLQVPTLAESWHQVNDSLSDIPALASEISRLRNDIAAVRLLRANLAAAGKASISADSNGERDPLSYLRDELTAQGYTGQAGRP